MLRHPVLPLIGWAFLILILARVLAPDVPFSH